MIFLFSLRQDCIVSEFKEGIKILFVNMGLYLLRVCDDINYIFSLY